MQQSTTPSLTHTLTGAMLALCLALCLTSPWQGAALATGIHQPDSSFVPLLRRPRSVDEEVPCVPISYLTVLKGRFIRWLDNNNDGTSTFDEVKDYLRRFKPNVNDVVVENFIRRRDLDGSGNIDLVPEYVQDMTTTDNSLEGATELFQLQDTNEDGFVEEQEIVQVGKALGATEQEAQETTHGYYMVADANKDGKLSFDEFKTLYNQ
ncbi:hypothetical protein BsWGS_03467 [Bradybaena similaris]